MMRKLVTSLVLLVAAAVSAEELTVDKILAAHSFGRRPRRSSRRSTTLPTRRGRR